MLLLVWHIPQLKCSGRISCAEELRYEWSHGSIWMGPVWHGLTEDRRPSRQRLRCVWVAEWVRVLEAQSEEKEVKILTAHLELHWYSGCLWGAKIAYHWVISPLVCHPQKCFDLCNHGSKWKFFLFLTMFILVVFNFKIITKKRFAVPNHH